MIKLNSISWFTIWWRHCVIDLRCYTNHLLENNMEFFLYFERNETEYDYCFYDLCFSSYSTIVCFSWVINRYLYYTGNEWMGWHSLFEEKKKNCKELMKFHHVKTCHFYWRWNAILRFFLGNCSSGIAEAGMKCSA